MGSRDLEPVGRAEPDPRAVEAPAKESHSLPPEPLAYRERVAVRGRGYAYQLSQAEMDTLRDIGQFRIVAQEDVLQFRYRGDTTRLHDDRVSLTEQGLVQERSVWDTRSREKTALLVLTKKGKALLEERFLKGSGQQVYAGLVKPAEVHHDAAIYRMYQAEAQKIARSGGRIERVVLDYELKRNVYRPLAKAKDLPAIEYARRQAAIATENKLRVVGGKILLPDLRIEYVGSGGDSAHVDLELATHHYRGSQMRAKAQAGFKMYAPSDSAAHLSTTFDPAFVAPIFSL